ncbi:MAG: HD family hydrolase [Chloroflexota bacterium]
MEAGTILALLRHGNQLKRTARTGWVQRGVANAEDVAAHSFGVTFTALILVEWIERPLNLERILMMATLHDLPEALTTDIPSPVWRELLPKGVKSDVERGAMNKILGDAPLAPALMDAWEELHANETDEAKLVHDADKLDMYLQALIYEQQTGNRRLAEFWEPPHACYFAEAQQIYDLLRQQRNRDA